VSHDSWQSCLSLYLLYSGKSTSRNAYFGQGTTDVDPRLTPGLITLVLRVKLPRWFVVASAQLTLLFGPAQCGVPFHLSFLVITELLSG
jgi:hypothetical protein